MLQLLTTCSETWPGPQARTTKSVIINHPLLVRMRMHMLPCYRQLKDAVTCILYTAVSSDAGIVGRSRDPVFEFCIAQFGCVCELVMSSRAKEP